MEESDVLKVSDAGTACSGWMQSAWVRELHCGRGCVTATTFGFEIVVAIRSEVEAMSTMPRDFLVFVLSITASRRHPQNYYDVLLY